MPAHSTLSVITKEAVDSAAEEYDRIGAQAFLDKYGFSHARDYHVVREGRTYPSKALLGAARAYVGDGAAALKASEFSGGRRTVVKRLSALGFTVPDAPRNENWRWEELVLALDLYFKAKILSAKEIDAECQSLSQTLGEMGRQLGVAKSDTYRNWNGVHLKLMNFRRLDPHFQSAGKVGMRRGAKAEEAVWVEYVDNPTALREEAERILVAIELSALIPTDDGTSDPYEAEEGGVQMRTHRYYERDRTLIRRKKADAAMKGRLACEACGFDFEASYGEVGSGFIEVHHIKPVHLIKTGEKTRLADLALLCSNCHRISHRRSPPLTIAELQMTIVASSTRKAAQSASG